MSVITQVIELTEEDPWISSLNTPHPSSSTLIFTKESGWLLVGCEIIEDEVEKTNKPAPNKQTVTKQQNRMIIAIITMISLLEVGFCLFVNSDSIAKANSSKGQKKFKSKRVLTKELSVDLPNS